MSPDNEVARCVVEEDSFYVEGFECLGGDVPVNVLFIEINDELIGCIPKSPVACRPNQLDLFRIHQGANSLQTVLDQVLFQSVHGIDQEDDGGQKRRTRQKDNHSKESPKASGAQHARSFLSTSQELFLGRVALS